MGLSGKSPGIARKEVLKTAHMGPGPTSVFGRPQDVPRTTDAHWVLYPRINPSQLERSSIILIAYHTVDLVSSKLLDFTCHWTSKLNAQPWIDELIWLRWPSLAVIHKILNYTAAFLPCWYIFLTVQISLKTAYLTRILACKWGVTGQYTSNYLSTISFIVAIEASYFCD